jgi:hypothetical protein
VPRITLSKAEVLRREWRARESRHALRLPRSGCGARLPLAYPQLGHRPPCLGLFWSIKVIACLLGEEVDFV